MQTWFLKAGQPPVRDNAVHKSYLLCMGIGFLPPEVSSFLRKSGACHFSVNCLDNFNCELLQILVVGEGGPPTQRGMPEPLLSTLTADSEVDGLELASH